MSTTSLNLNLFKPLKVGSMQLQNRVVMAPMTRMKATEKTHVPHVDLVREFYTQRACAPGTLLITEGTLVAQKAGTLPHVPGIWSDAQIDAWRTIIEGVHAKQSFIFSQLWALGRVSNYEAARAEDASIPYVAPSAIKLSTKEEVPRELTLVEIREYVQWYAAAARNAVHGAGFDGVEVHGANGYLIDQFIQDVSNTRTDVYGGSVENRVRFALEIVDAVVAAVGAERTGLRISPWNDFLEMRMQDPLPTFVHLISQLKAKHPTLAYIHVVEPRVDGSVTREAGSFPTEWSNDVLREIWGARAFISAGGYTRESALKATEGEAGSGNTLVAFGRPFLSNPDLVARLRDDVELNAHDRSTFHIPGNVSRGYTDYPFAAAN